MQMIEDLLRRYSQNSKLAIRLIAPQFGHLPADVTADFDLTHRKPHYFFLFMEKGSARHGVDLQDFDVNDGELLFILPHQIHQLPATRHTADYFKLGFDDNCLAQLPKQYPFLINPLNHQKIKFTTAAAARIQSIFSMLKELLSKTDTAPELILAHLGTLLTEINAAYFQGAGLPTDQQLSLYIRFKELVERHLTDHRSITGLATDLGINTNKLYTIVNRYAGVSPKEFITNRLMLEAKRRLYYSESTSIKELAYDLGFNDPEYFSRLFKKTTGRTITALMKDLSGS